MKGRGCISTVHHVSLRRSDERRPWIGMDPSIFTDEADCKPLGGALVRVEDAALIATSDTHSQALMLELDRACGSGSRQ